MSRDGDRVPSEPPQTSPPPVRPPGPDGRMARPTSHTGGPLARTERLPVLAPRLRQLERFELLGELGRGGMAVVYLARDRQLDREVALKLLADPLDARLSARLQREAEVAAKLRHPHIIGVHQVGHVTDDDGHEVWFIAMERVDGPTLSEALNELDWPTRLRILREVVSGVAHAHRHGIIHRDLKPANILLAGPERRAVVTDFGLARWLEAGHTLTETGAVLGTPAFMAPEQLLGARELTPAADVWALGVLLYQLAHGRLPFESQHTGELAQMILTLPPRPPLRRDHPGGAPLAAILATALDKQPTRRYPDAGALADELTRWDAGEPLRARAPSRVRALGRGVARHPWVMLAAALLAIAALLVAIGRRESGPTPAERLSEQARAAARAGRWAEAEDVAGRALELAHDPALSRLADDWRARRDAQRAEAARATRRQALLTELSAIAARIEQGRRYVYLADVDLAARRQELEALLGRLAALGKDPEHARLATLWTLLGRGWHAAGHRPRALAALERAVALAPDDAEIRYALGRIHLEQALDALLRGGSSRGAASRRALARQAHARAREHLARAKGGWFDAQPIDRHLLTVYAALAEDRHAVARTRCREGVRRFGDVLGAEAYWHILGWIETSREASAAAYQRALERRPHYAEVRLMQGALHHDYGELPEALAAYGRALRVNPHLLFGWVNRSGVQTQLGRHADAVADLDRAIEILPTMPELYAYRGAARQSGGDSPGALADYDRALERDPDLVIALAYRGTLRCQLQQTDEGLADLDRALTLDPNDGSALINRGQVHERLGRMDVARADYDRALQINPDDHYALANRGRMWQIRGDLDRARADIELALELDPNQVTALVTRSALASAGTRFAEALADLDRASRLAPDDQQVVFARAGILERMGRMDEAVAAYQAMIAAHPDDPRGYIGRGRVRNSLRDPRRALADLDRAVALAPRNILALSNRALVHAALGNLRQGIADFDVVLTLDPRYLPAYWDRARMRHDTGDPRAIEDLDRALALAPDDIETLFQRGCAHMYWLNQPRQALADYDRLLARAPDDHRALINRGLVRETLGDTTGALADYSRVLTRRPDDHHGLLNRGRLHLREQRRALALVDAEALLARYPRDATAHELRGDVHRLDENHAEARRDLERAVALDPKLWSAWDSLAHVLAAQGHAKASRATLKTAIGLAPPTAQARFQTCRKEIEAALKAARKR